MTSLKSRVDKMLDAWLYLRKPRKVSAAMTFFYGIFVLIGLGVLFDTPAIIYDVIPSRELVAWLGIISIIGGVAGIVSIWEGAWWLERSAIPFIITTLSTYVVVLGAVPLENNAKALLQALVALVGIGFIVRLIYIFDLDSDPGH